VERYDLIAVEDLKIANMTRSAKGTIEKPGVNVAQKAGLNRVILQQGWGILHTFLKYKSEISGSTTLSTPAPYTSQRCSRCGHTSPENRKTQAVFSCVSCGYTLHADVNAAVNVLADVMATAAGQAVAARRALSHDGREARTTRITVLSPRSASSAALAA
jgi:transposase